MTGRTVLAAFLAATPAFAEVPAHCADRDSLVAKLQESYGEHHHASGLQTEDTMVEVWVSYDTGTWTVLVTDADGRSCIAGFGEAWHEYAPRSVSSDVVF